MSKAAAQRVNVFFQYSGGSMAANAASSGSVICHGYSQIRGLFYSDAATETGSGLQILQSPDHGANFFATASNGIGASAITACAADLGGDAVKITIINGATVASNARWVFYTLPNN